MKRRNDLPAGWRQPPETTAEPVPLRRPYVPPGEVFASADLLPPLPARPRSPSRRWPGAAVQAPRQAPRQAPAGAVAQPPPRRAPAMRRWRPMRGIIGDAFRMPALWCEFGNCIGRYTSRDALGERDLRARALAAGWRYDPLGRVACPSCARQDPAFRGARPPALADQDPRRR